MKRMQTKTLVEASLLAALAALIMVISAYIPILSFIGTFAWPIPITILTFKYGIKTSILSLAVSLILASMITNPLSAISLGLIYGTTAVVLGYCLKKKHSPFITIGAMALTMFMGDLINIELAKVLTGIDPMNQFFTLLDESMKEAVNMMKSLGVPQEQLDLILGAEGLSTMMRMVFPGLLVMSSLLGAYISYYLVQITFKKLRYNITEVKPIDQWYIGNNISFGIFSMLIVSMAMMYFKVPNSDIVYNSIFIIFMFTFIIDGLAVVSWFLKSRRVGKGIRVLILILIMFTGLAQIVLFLGLADYIIDFRKINPWRRRRIPPGDRNE